MKTKIKQEQLWEMCFIFMISAAIVMVPDYAYAGFYSWSPVGRGVCAFAQAFTGQIAAGIATIAICTVGTLACLGRVQWTTALVVGVGVATIFGAAQIITMVAPSGRAVDGNSECSIEAGWI